MFPADPTLTAKPVTLTVGGSKGTVIGPLKVTCTPEELVRITLEKVFEDPEVFVNANVPDARVPGIICGRLLNPPGRAATVIPPISNTVSTPNKIASNTRVLLEVPPTPLLPGPPGALPLGG